MIWQQHQCTVDVEPFAVAGGCNDFEKACWKAGKDVYKGSKLSNNCIHMFSCTRYIKLQHADSSMVLSVDHILCMSACMHTCFQLGPFSLYAWKNLLASASVQLPASWEEWTVWEPLPLLLCMAKHQLFHSHAKCTSAEDALCMKRLRYEDKAVDQ